MAKDPNSRSGINKPGLLTLTIKDKSALYLAYMPFVQNGGLFIPTNSNYRIGDEVFMLLNLMGEDEKLPVAGRVIWVTPAPRSRITWPARCRVTRPRIRCESRGRARHSSRAAQLRFGAGHAAAQYIGIVTAFQQDKGAG
jgi:Tfp pilus assembly protein PilZ